MSDDTPAVSAAEAAAAAKQFVYLQNLYKMWSKLMELMKEEDVNGLKSLNLDSLPRKYTTLVGGMLAIHSTFAELMNEGTENNLRNLSEDLKSVPYSVEKICLQFQMDELAQKISNFLDDLVDCKIKISDRLDTLENLMGERESMAAVVPQRDIC